jgi:hypothetical protein
MKFAPIALFTYNRPRHTRQTVEALKQNELSHQSDLFIFSDGPKSHNDKARVAEVRSYIHGIKGFHRLNIIEHPDNLGLAESIITGVTKVVNKYGRIIVLEDDLLTSPFFLRYMNDALEHYEYEDKVISIQGYIFPVAEKLPTTFLLSCTGCLGWGTWKRGWRLFEKDGSKLLGELKRKGLEREFDIDGACRYLRMLKDQIAGRNSSWAIRWYASAFLNGRLNLFPHASLVQHIGSDGSGSHVANGCDKFDVSLARNPIPVESISIVENLEAKKIVANYLRSIKTPFAKAILNRIEKRLGKLIQG